MYASNLAVADERRERREDVHHRTRGTDAHGRSLTLVVVNISHHGLMARCDATLQEGDAVRIQLPIIGPVAAQVRWCLGGRFGCQFDKPLALATYYGVLAILLK